MKLIKESFDGVKTKLILGTFLKTIEAFFELLIPLYISKIINDGIINGNKNALYRIIIIMLILYLFGYICSLISQYFSSNVSQKVGKKLRVNIFSKIINLNQKEMDNFEYEIISNSITNDVKQIENGLNMAIRVGLRTPIVAIGSIIMASTINFKLSLIFICSTIIIFVFLYLFMSYLSNYYQKIQSKKDRLNSLVEQQVNGSRIIKSFNTQNTEIYKGFKINTEISKKLLNFEYLNSLLNPATYLIINIALIVILYLGNNYIKMNTISYGDVVALVNYLMQTFVSVSVLVNLVFIFSKFSSSYSRIKSILNYKTCKEQKRNHVINDIETLEFKNVSFGYNDDKILDNINFLIDKKMTIGIMGLTGSGKSTLAKLILNLYKPDNGNVLINGIDINKISKQNLKNNISIVMQKPNLFYGTLKYNFKLINKNITRNDMISSLKVSKIDDFIYNKSKGENMFILENGKNLSGGQKQRIAIAIALSKKPNLLILDDSSCALDLQTEYSLYKNLKDYDSAGITIIISQRISTMKMCDKIIVMDNGKISGYDTFDNLLKSNTIFKKIISTQEVGDTYEK
ncbi:MAG TPA: hypothetical protein DHV70_06560 [Firmicutes bacterium]|nr:hypothetical protein [Bacillota bacterium]